MTGAILLSVLTGFWFSEPSGVCAQNEICSRLYLIACDAVCDCAATFGPDYHAGCTQAQVDDKTHIQICAN